MYALKAEKNNGFTILRHSGNMLLEDSVSLRAELEGYMREKNVHKVAIDMSQTEQVDSSGLGALVAVQGVGVLCQARLFMLSDTERSRLNTVYVVSNFMFSALGSFLAAYAWREGGWELVAALAVGAAVLALASWAYDMVKRKERI